MSLENQIATLLERLGRLAANDQAAGGLNPVQWEALRYFARANRFSSTPSGLTAYLGVSKGSVSQTIGALERKGLLRKATNPANRRSVGIELTASGKQLLKRDPREQIKHDLGELSPAQQQKLRELLSMIVRRALEARGGLPFGICRTCEHFREDHDQGRPHYCAMLQEPLSQADGELICREHSG